MRTFIAVDLEPAIKKELGNLQARLKPLAGPLKWVDPQQIHVTLKFLGEIDERQATSVGKVLEDLAAQGQPFDISIEALGAFPPSGRVNVVWVGITDPQGRLADCQAQCEKLLASLGFPPENRRFAPHLTLARNKDPRCSAQVRAALARHPPFYAGQQAVSGLVFYQSTLTPQGPIYKAMSRHSFSG